MGRAETMMKAMLIVMVVDSVVLLASSVALLVSNLRLYAWLKRRKK